LILNFLNFLKDWRLTVSKNDSDSDLDWLAVIVGGYETWREKRWARAMARRKAIDARRQEKTTVWIAQGVATLGGTTQSAAHNCPPKKAVALWIKGARAAWAIHARSAATITGFLFAVWLLGSVACLAGSAAFNASDQWVSVETKKAQDVPFTKSEKVALNDARGIRQPGWVLYKKEAFFERASSRAAQCFAMNACKSMAFGWRGWLGWVLSGRPPDELARLGWESQSRARMAMQASPVATGAALFALLMLVVAGRCLLLDHHETRELGTRRRAARALCSARVSAWVLVLGSLGGLSAWMINGALTDLTSGPNDGAFPAWNAIDDVMAGKLSPKDAYWTPGTLALRNGATSEDEAKAKQCVASGFCPSSASDDALEDQTPSPAVMKNRQIARQMGFEEARRGDWNLYTPLGCLGTSLWIAAFLFGLGIDEQEDAKVDEQEEKLKALAMRGRPRLERAKLMAEASKGRAASPNGKQPPAKRRPKSL